MGHPVSTQLIFGEGMDNGWWLGGLQGVHRTKLSFAGEVGFKRSGGTERAPPREGTQPWKLQALGVNCDFQD